MSKGGKRLGAGSPLWEHLPTKVIRVPSIYSSHLLKIARILDNHESIELAFDAVRDIYASLIDVDADFSLVSGHLENEDISFEDVMRRQGIESLYYITHSDNVLSILDRGILSHSCIQRLGISHQRIYNSEVINLRANRVVNGEKTLWNYANLYFQPRNAMLYSLVKKYEKSLEKLAIICVKKSVLRLRNIFISTGNAASADSEIFPIETGKEFLSNIRDQIDNDWWKNDDGSKRKLMAECLIPEKISPTYIQGIYVPSEDARIYLSQCLTKSQRFKPEEIPIVSEPKRFFQPEWIKPIVAGSKRNIKLVKGDLFLSKMQTLTISVNCVGVMGKGLASTAKYRFPDVYVKYQDLCKQNKISYSSPSLYTRESSVFTDLYDEYLGIDDVNSSDQTWFLLFATKNHWKNKSDIDGIEQGLKWLLANYKEKGIKSLALPALGCGQGGLDWSLVGPLMCKYLVQMSIQVAIYLPNEKNIPDEQLTSDFLLRSIDF